MKISLSPKNVNALAKALATMKSTGVACMVNRRGEHSLIPTRRMHLEDKRQIVKIVTPKL